MDKETILSYLEDIKHMLIVGQVISGYKQLEFVINELKCDIKQKGDEQ